MLGEDAPVRLRLVATQATAGDAGYHTLQEFSDAVAYFARPDADSLLRNLHLRALDAELSGEVPQGLDSTDEPKDTFEPKQTSEPKQASEQPQPAKRGHRNRLVLAGIAAGVVCAAVLGIPRGSEGPAVSAVATVQNV